MLQLDLFEKSIPRLLIFEVEKEKKKTRGEMRAIFGRIKQLEDNLISYAMGKK